MQSDGPKIRRQRELAGYGLRRFAAAAGLSHTHLSRIERGERNPQPEVMARIADTLGCDIADIEQTPRSPNERDEHRLAIPDDEGTRGRPPQDP